MAGWLGSLTHLMENSQNHSDILMQQQDIDGVQIYLLLSFSNSNCQHKTHLFLTIILSLLHRLPLIGEHYNTVNLNSAFVNRWGPSLWMQRQAWSVPSNGRGMLLWIPLHFTSRPSKGGISMPLITTASAADYHSNNFDGHLINATNCNFCAILFW